MAKLKYLILSFILVFSFSALSAKKWSDTEGLKIVEKHLISKGYKWGDFKPEINTKENPVLHVFVNKDTGAVIGHITND